MSGLTIYHNPQCSKSVEALTALQKAGVPVDVRLYLEDPPNAGEVLTLIEKLGDWRPLLRDEGLAPELRRRPDTTSREVSALVARDPSVLQRPLLVQGDRAAIVRKAGELEAFLSSA